VATPVTAAASLIDVEGRPIGEARLQQTPHGVLVKLDLRNATPGVHAVHIHQVGKCDRPSFESAGPHVAASSQQHGFLNSAIVLHSGKDDYVSDPAGNSGDRIGCGRIER
jgi:Cu-Zn family superoxide dismutase